LKEVTVLNDCKLFEFSLFNAIFYNAFYNSFWRRNDALPSRLASCALSDSRGTSDLFGHAILPAREANARRPALEFQIKSGQKILVI